MSDQHDLAHLRSLEQVLREQIESCQRRMAACAGRNTREFRRQLSRLADQTLKELDELQPAFCGVADLRLEVLLRLETRSNLWRVLSELTGGAVHADAEFLPRGLIEFSKYEMRRMTGDRRLQFVFLADARSNFSWHRCDLRSFGLTLSDLPEILFVGFPQVYAGMLLPNLLLWHEFGHYVFEETGVFDRLMEDANVSTAAGEPALEQARTWCAEIFADLFGTAAVGPAYTGALLQYGPYLSSFSNSHPATAVRLKAQLEFLAGPLQWGGCELFDSVRAKSENAIDLHTALAPGATDECVVDSSEARSIFAALNPFIGRRLDARFPALPGRLDEAVTRDMDALRAEIQTTEFWMSPKLASIVPSRKRPAAVFNAFYEAVVGFQLPGERAQRPDGWTLSDWKSALERWAARRLTRARLNAVNW